MKFACMPVGDQAVEVQFAQTISEQVNAEVTRLHKKLAQRDLRGIVEMVPAYASLMVYYDPMLVSYESLMIQISACVSESREERHTVRKLWLPALYGGTGGPDLADVAKENGLTTDEVIRLHAGAVYRVYMLGFAPGFPYLGGLPDSLATPRLAVPRALVPKGSVGIAGSQTGIYSLDTPGGWRIIAHMPVPLFQLDRQRPFLLAASDLVQFVPVEMAEYLEICREIADGTYNVKEEVACRSI